MSDIPTKDPYLHIPLAQILIDINDTNREIYGLEHDLEGAKVRNDRWGIMKAEHGLKERREFVEKLKDIINKRGL